MTKKLLLSGIVAVTAVAVACGEKAATPVSPSPAVSSETAAAAADGSTLKATAAAPQQPANGSTADSLAPNLTVANSTLKYLGDVAIVGTMQYRFVVETTGGASVHSALANAGAGLTTSKVPANLLQIETTYRWRARAEEGASVGPWSAYWTFTTPKAGGGSASYQNATELWDNLTDGRTIGTLERMANPDEPRSVRAHARGRGAQGRRRRPKGACAFEFLVACATDSAWRTASTRSCCFRSVAPKAPMT